MTAPNDLVARNDMSEIKRWRFWSVYIVPECWEEKDYATSPPYQVREETGGPYVLASDHDAEVARQNERAARYEAQIARPTAELEEARRNQTDIQQLREAVETVTALRAERDALTKDAGRYSWLRQHLGRLNLSSNLEWVMHGDRPQQLGALEVRHDWETFEPESVDAAIDAAIEKERT